MWQRRTLAKAASRLARAQLSAAVARWVRDWRVAEKERAEKVAAAAREAREEQH